ncbi:unnamed protein product [Allacma fusca]|uniref:Uncharacterized protein n=1 Tax=Allacma fusca TaxID=39272 RepID=A0A8J2JJY7_9HEXA|nr:unnamed protein product [Allacma fusca]
MATRMPITNYYTIENDQVANLIHDFNVGSNDTTEVEPLTGEAVVGNLTLRFRRDIFYTYIGHHILISINPYKPLSIYSDQVKHLYRTASPFELPPHIYSLVKLIHQRNIDGLESEQILVTSGESGSGKTQVSKIGLNFFVNDDLIGNKLKDIDILLGGMGNAKTARNDNSSRFGKFLDIQVDFKGDALGGVLHTYLLEKWRITKLASNCQKPTTESERNFHLFYLLLAGAEPSLIKALKLQRSVDNYILLKTNQRSNTIVQDLTAERLAFQEFKRSLSTFIRSESSVSQFFKIIAAILKLGNVNFIPVSNIDGTEGCGLEFDYELIESSELLGVPFDTLRIALTTRNSDYKVELTSNEANAEKEILIRNLYSRLFTWVVSEINRVIIPPTAKLRRIGFLDFYGFEILEDNSLEQFLINYTNEKLQHVLIDMELRSLQEDFLREGIEWIVIDTKESYFSLMEKNSHGLIYTLNGSNEENLLPNLIRCCGESEKQSHNCFRIKHFAGTVNYNLNSFIPKNTDHIRQEVACILNGSRNNQILPQLFPEGSRKTASPCGGRLGRPQRRPTTAATQLQTSLNALLKNLTPNRVKYYVFCIKPNELKQPNLFETALVNHQVRYLRLLDVTKINQLGYIYSIPYNKFLSRYKLLSLITWPAFRGDVADGAGLLLSDLQFGIGDYIFGRTKVFLKNSRVVWELEEFRRERMDDLALLVQKTWRGWREVVRLQKLKQSQVILARGWRQCLLRRQRLHVAQRKRTRWAVAVIENCYIHWKRKLFLLHLAHHLPPLSPISRDWPLVPHYISESSLHLRRIFHRWRCHVFRLRIDENERNRMGEKVTASLIFKDRKSSYHKSVSHPFIGDYVRLRQNSQWRRSATNDQLVVFADLINKVARSGGKCKLCQFVPIVLVVTTNNVLVLDPRTLGVKYRISVKDIYKISLSPYPDDIAVIHVQQQQLESIPGDDAVATVSSPPSPPTAATSHSHHGCSLFSEDGDRLTKGDLVVHTCHVIEMVTKVYLVVKNANGLPPVVDICEEFPATFANQRVLVSFKYNHKGGPMEAVVIPPATMRVTRKPGRMEFFL